MHPTVRRRVVCLELTGADRLADNPVRQYYADYVKDISPSASAVFSGLPTAAKAVSTTSKVAPAILLLDALRRGGESTNTEGF